MPSFKCRDLGMDCNWESTAPTRDALMKKITDHAGKAHKMTSFPPEFVAKVNAAIKM